MGAVDLNPPERNKHLHERTAHVATVHWHSDLWIETQLRSFKRHLPAHTRLYAYLDGIPGKWSEQFDVVFTDDEKTHAEKLNHLAEVALASGDAGDLLVFVDGDAFPIADLSSLVAELEDTPLIAVQRLENSGDLQPHPCFCLTTLGYWREIAGDWQPGGYWTNAQGRQITDVGGRLLKILEDRGDAWKPLLRSNFNNLHPLWFGVYGNLVYHHGAGFRDKLCRLDAQNGIDRLSRTVMRLQRRLSFSRRAPALDHWLTRRVRNYMRWRNARQSRRVEKIVLRNPDFSRELGFTQ